VKLQAVVGHNFLVAAGETSTAAVLEFLREADSGIPL
jgi:hypothetical protein